MVSCVISRWRVCAVILIGLGFAPAAAQDKEAEWKDILAQIDTAQKIKGETKRQAYADLCPRLTTYLNNHLYDKLDDEETLKVVFLRSMYHLYVGEVGEAKDGFEWCRVHKKLGSTLFGDPEQPLSKLLAEQQVLLEEVLRPDSGSVTSVEILDIHIKKEHYFEKLAYIKKDKSHDRLKGADWFAVSLRKLPKNSYQAARKLGTRLLQADKDLRFQSGMVSGSMTVFGITTKDSENASEYLVKRGLRQLRDTLRSANSQLRSTYFGRNNNAHLIVYANFDGSEEVGRRISKAIHLKSRNNWASYYSALDSSIVLRKNLGNRDEFHFGSALHELVHSLVRRDFPLAPRWLDEGMASLYEENAGGPKLHPIDNYRHYYLAEAIRQEKMPSVATLFTAKADDWSGKKAPLTIAMARYFALFLLNADKNENKLKEVYAAVRAEAKKKTPRSAKSLVEETLGMKMPEIDRRFKSFVAKRSPDEKKWGRLRDKIFKFVCDLEE